MPQTSYTPDKKLIRSLKKTAGLTAIDIYAELVETEYELGMASVNRVLQGKRATEDTLRGIARVLKGDAGQWRSLIEDARVITITIPGNVPAEFAASEVACLKYVREHYGIELTKTFEVLSLVMKDKWIIIDIKPGSVLIEILGTERDASELIRLFRAGFFKEIPITEVKASPLAGTTQTRWFWPETGGQWWSVLSLFAVLMIFGSAWFLRPIPLDDTRLSVTPAGRMVIEQQGDEAGEDGTRPSRLALEFENLSHEKAVLPTYIYVYPNASDAALPCAGYFLSTGEKPTVGPGASAIVRYESNDIRSTVRNLEFFFPEIVDEPATKDYVKGEFRLPLHSNDSDRKIMKRIPVWILLADQSTRDQES
ncbi:MAG: hypothetical protein AAFX06_11930 [Planctomycetota bacterium]